MNDNGDSEREKRLDALLDSALGCSIFTTLAKG